MPAFVPVSVPVSVRALVQAVKRNAEKFPSDFAFQLANQEVASLRSQFVISKTPGRGGRTWRVWAFTEHGAVMAATVLQLPAAIDVSVYVVRAFIHMLRAVAAQAELADKLQKLKRGLAAKFSNTTSSSASSSPRSTS